MTHEVATVGVRGDRSAFRRLWAVTGVSNLGDGITLVALPWIAATITRDPVAIAAVAVAGRLPWLVVTLPGGALIDLMDRKTVLVLGNAARILLFAALGVVLAVGGLSMTHVLVIAFVLGCIEVVYDTALPTYLPTIVSPTDLASANGKVAAVELVTNEFAGKPLGGLLVGIWMPLAFFSRAVASVCAIVLLLPLPSDRPAPAPRTGLSASQRFMFAGLRLLWDHQVLRTYTLVVVWVNVALSFVVATQVLWVGDVLGLDAFGYGVLLAVSAVGGVLGGQVSGWLNRRVAPGRLILLGVFLLIVVCGALAVTASAVLAAALYAVASFAVVVVSVVSLTARQELAPPEMLGRVMSASRFLTWSLTPVAFFLGGVFVGLMENWVSVLVALQAAYGAAAILLVLCLAALGPRLWRFERTSG